MRSGAVSQSSRPDDSPPGRAISVISPDGEAASHRFFLRVGGDYWVVSEAGVFRVRLAG